MESINFSIKISHALRTDYFEGNLVNVYFAIALSDEILIKQQDGPLTIMRYFNGFKIQTIALNYDYSRGKLANAIQPSMDDNEVDSEEVEGEELHGEYCSNDIQITSNQQTKHSFDNMLDCNVKSGMEVPSSEFVSDDCLADDVLGGSLLEKRNSEKGDDGVVRYVSFTCCREGPRKTNRITSLNPLPTIEIGCRARLEHNHKTSPSKSRLYRCNRKLSAQVKRRLKVNDIAGIPLHKSYDLTIVEAGGFENMTCVEKDCRNFIDRVQRLRLGEGHATALQSYFLKMQVCSPGFYFSIDLAKESRLKNVFWADNRCRQAYKEFGDVVTFDTTYLTNKYDMPFAPFVGVNHHGQSTLSGRGLVSNEETNIFVWLFKIWIECMQGEASDGIIKD
ncbi:protein FAR1-RELATED SEQUENCE 5-like [Olea europaea var. sylvestris]|uniref:protein FAR1-RELATED SEQUENCE 5-like n=1 Tax=Olea europaea var. sylvestris TaxID=158386 RepID=UPI000C1D0E02|nr:protein FAR1-RELATED SEQUENCE 5-like [Olea europaea var. sylvestris]